MSAYTVIVKNVPINRGNYRIDLRGLLQGSLAKLFFCYDADDFGRMKSLDASRHPESPHN